MKKLTYIFSVLVLTIFSTNLNAQDNKIVLGVSFNTNEGISPMVEFNFNEHSRLNLLLPFQSLIQEGETFASSHYTRLQYQKIYSIENHPKVFSAIGIGAGYGSGNTYGQHFVLPKYRGFVSLTTGFQVSNKLRIEVSEFINVNNPGFGYNLNDKIPLNTSFCLNICYTL